MKTLTTIIIVAITAFLIVWDVYAILKGGVESSISSIIIVHSHEYPILPFAFGVLCGHFFWRMKPNKDTKEIDE
jgi:hypothetical protein